MKKTIVLTIITLILGINTSNPFVVYASDQGSLGVTCYPNRTSANINDLIEWRVSTYGGDGNYNITWSGLDSLSGSGTSASIKYSTGGAKTASVSVTSGGQTISASCGNTIIYDSSSTNNSTSNNSTTNYYGPLTVSCSVNSTFAPVGTKVTWQAYPLGGNGGYSYTWSGTDNVVGNGNPVSYIYNSPGTKTASVTVDSNNQSVTKACTNEIMIGAPIVYTTQDSEIIEDEPISEPIISEPVVETTPPEVNTLSSFISLSNVPWIWVLVLVILVMVFMFSYLLFNKRKI